LIGGVGGHVGRLGEGVWMEGAEGVGRWGGKSEKERGGGRVRGEGVVGGSGMGVGGNRGVGVGCGGGVGWVREVVV